MKKLFLVLITVLSLGASSLAMANEYVPVRGYACPPVKRVVVVAPPVFHPYRFYNRVAFVRDARFWHNHYGYRYF
jgi:hypothetical protein